MGLGGIEHQRHSLPHGQGQSEGLASGNWAGGCSGEGWCGEGYEDGEHIVTVFQCEEMWKLRTSITHAHLFIIGRQEVDPKVGGKEGEMEEWGSGSADSSPDCIISCNCSTAVSDHVLA